jgi:AcrR family transcriptional regulator
VAAPKLVDVSTQTVVSQRPKRADARRNFDRLVAQARAAFAERGTDASLEEIARRAGVGIGTLYRHFPTRQALVVAVVRDRMEELHARAAALLTEPSPEDALIRWLWAYLEHAGEFRGLADSMAETVQTDSLTSCDQMKTAANALLARAQQAGVIRSDVDTVDLLQFMHAVAWSAERCGQDTGRAGRMLAVMLDGLRVTPADQTGR